MNKLYLLGLVLLFVPLVSALSYCDYFACYNNVGGSPLFDKSDLGNNLTNNGAIYNQTDGSYIWNGSWARMTVPLSIVGYNSISFGAWINPATSLSSSTGIISWRSSSMGLFQSTSAQKIACGITNSTALNGVIVVSNTKYTTATWEYYFCTYNGTNVFLYRNGVLVSSLNMTGNISYSSYTSNYYPWIGKQKGGTELNFNGSIDNVQIYNRSLSAQEVSALYNNGRNGAPVNRTGLIAYYDFSNNTLESGVSSYNSKFSRYFGYGCIGTFCYMNDNDVVLNLPLNNISNISDYSRTNSVMIACPTCYINETDNSYYFDGSGKLYTTTSTNTTTEFTLSMWLWRNSTGWDSIFYKGNIKVDSYKDGKIKLYYTNNSNAIWTSPLGYNNWYHLAIVNNATDYSIIYKDGVPINALQFTFGNTPVNGTLTYIGGDTGTNYLQQGKMSKVIYFNRSLSAEEILAIYNEGRN